MDHGIVRTWEQSQQATRTYTSFRGTIRTRRSQVQILPPEPRKVIPSGLPRGEPRSGSSSDKARNKRALYFREPRGTRSLKATLRPFRGHDILPPCILFMFLRIKMTSR